MHPLPSRTILLAALLVLVARIPADADDGPTVRGRIGFEHSSNPERRASSAGGGWALRSYVSSGATLFRSDRTYARVQYQSGIRRRFTQNAQGGGRPGVTVLNDVELDLYRGLSDALTLALSGRIKSKSVTRIPWENGYLQESGRGVLKARAPLGIAGELLYARTAEAPEDSARAGFSVSEIQIKISRYFTRRLRSYLQFSHKNLDFDRRAEVLISDPPQTRLEATDRDREDRLRQFDLGLQVYRGGMLSLSYAYQSNRSNSYGYAFRAHRIVLLSTSTVPFDAVLQTYGIFQIREYTEALPGPAPEYEEEYEHTVLTAKLSRMIVEPYELEVEYSLRRSGLRDANSRYTEHVGGIAFNLVF